LIRSELLIDLIIITVKLHNINDKNDMYLQKNELGNLNKIHFNALNYFLMSFYNNILMSLL